MIGWAMTGGQDRAAAVRRVALAAAVRVAPVREAIASTATPRLKAGALQHRARPGSRGVRAGSLIPNPLVRVQGPGLVRLDAVLAGQAAVLTAREPDQPLAGFCERYGLALLRIRPGSVPDGDPGPLREAAAGGDREVPWTDVCLPAVEQAGPVRALLADPGLSVLVRPDRVIAAVAVGRRLPEVPWQIRPRARPQHPDAASFSGQDPAVSRAAEPWSPPCS